MRDINDLKNAFGKADEGFKNTVFHTLADLKKHEERKPLRKMSLRTVAVAAVLCLLATGTALSMTNTWGILDFLSGRSADAEVLPDAAGLLQTELPQNGGESELVNFSVREAIYDGNNVYIIAEATPAKPEYLLLGTDAATSDPIGNMGPLFEGQSGTIGEYAAANNKIPVHTSIMLKAMNGSIDFILEADGKLIYMISAACSTDEAELPLELTYVTAPFTDEKIDTEAIQENTLTVTLQNSETYVSLNSSNTAEYADCGVRVDKITMTRTPMALYAEIEYTVIDAKLFGETDGGLWFEFIDSTGDALPSGAGSSGSIEPLDENGTRFVQKTSVRAVETLFDEITLRGYNAWDKNRYETHTFEMR